MHVTFGVQSQDMLTPGGNLDNIVPVGEPYSALLDGGRMHVVSEAAPFQAGGELALLVGSLDFGQ